VRGASRAALAVVLALGGLAACGGGDDDAAPNDDGPLVRPADEGIDGVLAIRIPPYEHTQAKVDYDRRPPAGGDHGSVAAPCGFYVQPIADEYLVHTMEHGAVWLAYAQDLEADAVAVLRAEVEEHEDLVATLYPGLDDGVAVVASAWGRQLTLESVSDPRLDEFVQEYRNFDTAPEKDVACQPLPEGQGG
jgi:hypothetical protein